MPSFADALDTKVSDIKAAPPWPIGTYLMVIEGMPEYIDNNAKTKKGLAHKGKILQIMQDVEQDKVMEWQDETKEKLTGQILYGPASGLTFWEPNLTYLTAFYTNIGLGELALGMAISESPGRQFLAVVRHRPSQDGKRMEHFIHETKAV